MATPVTGPRFRKEITHFKAQTSKSPHWNIFGGDVVEDDSS